jgi:3-deoxy-D-manno-octulosonate 8-phosphate phosphatase (KDO 8-P phosphatase)
MNFKSRLNAVTTFIFDVDGVLTDGKVFLLPGGHQVRNMNIKDGYALQLAVKKGYKICIISGGKSEDVKQRLSLLGIEDIFMSAHDKLSVYKDFIAEHEISDNQVLYMGDDLPDYEVLQRVGAATCPNDAAEEIKNVCQYISAKKGGEGCVRDVIEQVMRVQGKWAIEGW